MNEKIREIANRDLFFELKISKWHFIMFNLLSMGCAGKN